MNISYEPIIESTYQNIGYNEVQNIGYNEVTRICKTTKIQICKEYSIVVNQCIGRDYRKIEQIMLMNWHKQTDNIYEDNCTFLARLQSNL